jgi:hypothetical protein
MAPDTTGNGLLQTISPLSERIKGIVPLGNRLWKVREGDHKSTIMFLWGEAGRIDKVLHRKLLQVIATQAKLGEHGMEGSRFQFIPGIADNGEPFPIVQRPVASLAALRDKCDSDAALTSKPSHSAHEFVACHGEEYRTYMTDYQAECCSHFRCWSGQDALQHDDS